MLTLITWGGGTAVCATRGLSPHVKMQQVFPSTTSPTSSTSPSHTHRPLSSCPHALSTQPLTASTLLYAAFATSGSLSIFMHGAVDGNIARLVVPLQFQQAQPAPRSLPQSTASRFPPHTMPRTRFVPATLTSPNPLTHRPGKCTLPHHPYHPSVHMHPEPPCLSAPLR